VAVAAAVGFAPSAALAAPTAADDSYTVSAGALFTTPLGLGVLANDLGVDLSALVSVSTGPAHGVLSSVGAGGGFSYLPAEGFVGVDVFSYCVRLLPGTPCVTANATVSLTVNPVVERIGGADRYAVSAGVSAAKFEPQAGSVYIASGAVFPDALSASAAAGAEGAPVLLVTRDTIPVVVAEELRRLEPQKIVVLGGTNTIGAAVEAALRGFSPVLERIGGADRYAVSAAISEATFGPARPVAYIASGEVFPDALSGSAAAGARGGPVLLVQKGVIPEVVADELDRLDPAKIVVLGGLNTIAESVMTELSATATTSRIAGADRFDVSANVSLDTFRPGNTRTVYVASGEVFPDALSGWAAAIKNHAPVLLVTKNAIPASVAAELDRLHPTRIVVLGGTNTISEAVAVQLAGHLAH
jgi:putative cell wall-binding protein